MWGYIPSQREREDAELLCNLHVRANITSLGSPGEQAIAAHEQTLCAVPRWYLRELAEKMYEHNASQVTPA